MQDPAFDLLFRNLARSSTRRATLAALIGGIFLLNQPEATVATASNEPPLVNPIAIRVDNTKGKSAVTVRHWGSLSNRRRPNSQCCVHKFVQPDKLITRIPPGGHHTFEPFRNDFPTWFIQINNKYWFQFHNPVLAPPFAQIAIDGSFPTERGRQWAEGFNCCYLDGIPAGKIVEWKRTFKEGQTRHYNIENKALFTVRRHSDIPGRKFFTVTPPPTL